MKVDIAFIGLIGSLFFIFTIFWFIRVSKLREQYAMLWLLLSLVMLMLSLFPALLNKSASVLGIIYAPSLLYLLGIVGTLFIVLHLTVAVSALSQRVTALVQTVALQERELQSRRIAAGEVEAMAQSQTAGRSCIAGHLSTAAPSDEMS